MENQIESFNWVETCNLVFNLSPSGCYYNYCYCPWATQYSKKCSMLQEYERAVIFRLGRLVSGGARGPGVFFIIPCVDVYEKIDMRTQTYEIPPQEVQNFSVKYFFLNWFDLDFNQGFSDSVCKCYHVLQS